VRDEISLTSDGSAFHARGTAMEISVMKILKKFCKSNVR